MPLSAIVRRFIPLVVRQEIKHHWRRLQDVTHGIRFDTGMGRFICSQPICIVQPIRHSTFYDNKIINITRGAALLNQSLIGPNQNWSFWHRIHRPDAANGFVAGRNLVNGQLIAQTGGGLCQLSSMVYHLALLTGLTIIERHAHSVDIYEEHQRFTPLGADATVVWGFKDLRLHNPQFVRIPLQKPFVKINTVLNDEIFASTIYEQKQGLQTVSIQA
jgi:vancomycin resistance protein VanW